MKSKLLFISIIISSFAFAQTKLQRLQLANEMEHSIQTELLNKWYPQCVDGIYGGFISTYTYDFKPTGALDKFIVTQARHTLTTEKASELYPNVS
jgi:mannobiose 2-epimerase